MSKNSFGALSEFRVEDRSYRFFRLGALARAGVSLERLPFSVKVMLENLLRREDGQLVSPEQVEALARWDGTAHREISFLPARVLLQDFTGVPVVADLAAVREAIARLGGKPAQINPTLPTDLVIDHSVQVDVFGSAEAFARNAELEFVRNRERYLFLRWGQATFANFRVVPPDTGIVHQVNLEYLARVVWADQNGLTYPDTVLGTDSHTTMVNGLGVVGWGVGGIEAEVAMLGRSVPMLMPAVVGVKLTGAPAPGTTATDLVLAITERLRKHGVVGKFVEFFGDGLSSLSVADRATLGNMAPEYGATIGFFPVDDKTLDYLRLTGRPEHQVRLVEAYCKEQGLFRREGQAEPLFSERLELDLGSLKPSLAGPRRPQDRVPLAEVSAAFARELARDLAERGAGGAGSSNASALPAALARKETAQLGSGRYEIGHGVVAIAAITSCTNTSNPSVMVGAGLLAKKAVARGLRSRPWVKTSLAPGSKAVTSYLRKAGLLEALETLGFNLVGYGCTTCIGNSGPLPEPVAEAIRRGNLVACAVLSGNRNFEGRIHPLTRFNYLASPPLVVAYALAGRIDIDLEREPLGTDRQGKPVYLRELWPAAEEIQAAVAASVNAAIFAKEYQGVFEGDSRWRSLAVPEGELFAWEAQSTYVKAPPFVEEVSAPVPPLGEIAGARVLAMLGDSVTTDHISPAGSIAAESPAGRYLVARGVKPADFNSYGARRGNHEVMVRGTYANIRLKNLLVAGTEGGLTVHLPDGERMTIFEASERYRAEGVPLLVIAGKEYGSGSSRDWAAKGPRLLGVRAVIAESFERIHRSNLVGMGILPLEFIEGTSARSLGLTGKELYSIVGLAAGLSPGARLKVRAEENLRVVEFEARARVDTAEEVEYMRHGGILPYVVRTALAR